MLTPTPVLPGVLRVRAGGGHDWPGQPGDLRGRGIRHAQTSVAMSDEQKSLSAAPRQQWWGGGGCGAVHWEARRAPGPCRRAPRCGAWLSTVALLAVLKARDEEKATRRKCRCRAAAAADCRLRLRRRHYCHTLLRPDPNNEHADHRNVLTAARPLVARSSCCRLVVVCGDLRRPRRHNTARTLVAPLLADIAVHTQTPHR